MNDDEIPPRNLLANESDGLPPLPALERYEAHPGPGGCVPTDDSQDEEVHRT